MAELSYKPTFRDRSVDWAARLMGGDREDYSRANSFADVLDWTPVGGAWEAYDVGRDIGYGDMLGAGIGTVSAALPGPPIKKVIKAFHGSPHDFDKFSMDKIGTGEGAQAYGHGLYFAENEGVAKAYKELGSRNNMDYRVEGGGKIPAWVAQRIEGGESPDEYIALFKGRIAEAEGKVARQEGQYWNDQSNLPGLQAIVQDLERLKSGAKASAPAHMYEVSINADPDDFLDWDRPLGEQSPRVKEILGAHTDLTEDDLAKLTPRHIAPSTTTGNQTWVERGIPGIRYKDAGSRGAEGGTNNYVLFDDKLIEIVRKYGIAGAAALGYGGMLGQLENGEGSLP